MSNDLVTLGVNLAFLDEQYARYVQDPTTVDPSWRRLFETGGYATETYANGSGYVNGNGASSARHLADHTVASLQTADAADAPFGRVQTLVNAFRELGHMEAQIDPLDHQPKVRSAELDPRTYGFTAEDMARVVGSGGLLGVLQAPLSEIVARLRAIYCGSIGVELAHITSTERRAWLEERMEPTLNRAQLDDETRRFVLARLTAAETFERYCHTKFVGTKRFSLEGAESLIPMIELGLEQAAEQGVKEVVIGMAHRGRLNVLANVLGKTATDLFAEFEDIDPETMFGGGDVKYHLGFSSDKVTRTGKKLHLSLAFNPSHLEAVNPVVVGRVRAKQRFHSDKRHERVLGVLIHGDAAFAGQGLVPETLNLSDIHGYRSGGTLHIIVNNQIGFTTLPKASRSTPYCTDVAKGIQVPIFHVNGDDPEAVVQTVRLAMDYRRQFRSDVIIDMLCYRKYGHNEGDEPGFTQPALYRAIEAHESVRALYGKRLVDTGVLKEGDVPALVAEQTARLDDAFAHKTRKRPQVSAFKDGWMGYLGGPDAAVPEVETGVAADLLAKITDGLTTAPDGFHVHPKVVRLLQQRAQMGKGEALIDWGMGEALAFGSLVMEKTLVRLSGQDSRRGTFSQRHAVLVDQETEAEYLPLASLRDEQAYFRIYDSPLSEAGVLGFEFGYSLDRPDALILWEAQFGDFVNGAQVIIDQFITSSEDKWKRISGLVLLLPHGFEGQGPEHSSARFERILQACAEDNIQVCYPSTPAQYFHLLRRQVVRKWRKPLFVMTPKSLLRLPAARSALSELTAGHFQRVLDDPEPPPVAQVKRVLLCTGKVYYDLVDERKKLEDTRTAIVRIEQLYPLSDEALTNSFARYPACEEVVWVQEEPQNMGAYTFLMMRLYRLVGSRTLRAASRVESASPATGSQKAHALEQQQLVTRAFGPLSELTH